MKTRHALATAVTCAVATPALLLTAGPAFADTGASVALSRTVTAPSVAELEKAVAEAKKAYDAAVTAEAEYQKILDAKLNDTTHPLAVAAAQAKAEAEKAAAAKTAADKAVTDAEAAVKTVVDDPTSTDDQRVAAFKALSDARKAAEAAAEAKSAADAKSTAANTALSDYRVQLFRQLSVLQQATKDALTTLQAAEKALKDAKEAGSGGTGSTPKPSPSTPGTGGSATPTTPGTATPGTSKPPTSDSAPQDGASSASPAAVGASTRDADGSLANTGSPSALPKYALTGAAAVALGAGAVFVVRRRQTAGRTTA
jgi:colicin import membrane protein